MALVGPMHLDSTVRGSHHLIDAKGHCFHPLHKVVKVMAVLLLLDGTLAHPLPCEQSFEIGTMLVGLIS